MLKYVWDQQSAINPDSIAEKDKWLTSSYVLLMEDDFTICTHGLRSLHYMIDKATSYFPNWIGLRVSYGLNGVVLKSSDLPALIAFYEKVLQEHVQHRKRLEPPDHLIYSFLYTLQQERGHDARPLVAYRYNLFSHIGVSSTFTGRKPRYNPECYQVLYDWLQPYERFRNEDCPDEDISPCVPQRGTVSEGSDDSNNRPGGVGPFSPESLIDWDVNAKQLCRLHFPLCDKGSGVTTREEATEHGCRLRGT